MVPCRGRLLRRGARSPPQGVGQALDVPRVSEVVLGRHLNDAGPVKILARGARGTVDRDLHGRSGVSGLGALRGGDGGEEQSTEQSRSMTPAVARGSTGDTGASSWHLT
jgi:hypothetical protein